MLSNTLDTITTFPEPETFAQDGASTYPFPTRSGNGSYSYNGATAIISPIAGKVFVVKRTTANMKFEILSYYQSAPAAPEATSVARYFTFKFVYQANSTTTF